MRKLPKYKRYYKHYKSIFFLKINQKLQIKKLILIFAFIPMTKLPKNLVMLFLVNFFKEKKIMRFLKYNKISHNIIICQFKETINVSLWERLMTLEYFVY